MFVRHAESAQNVAIKNGEPWDETMGSLTSNGIYQAKLTGKYFKKIFGKFDVVFTSPVKRCVETTDIIVKKIKHDRNAIILDYLIEIGELQHKFEGLSKKEINDLIKSNTNITTLENKISKTKNPFDLFELKTKLLNENLKFIKPIPNLEDNEKACEKILNLIKKSEYVQVLIVTHGGFIDGMVRYLSNISRSLDTIYITTKIIKEVDEYKGNCMIMCVGLIGNDWKIISTPSTKHLNG